MIIIHNFVFWPRDWGWPICYTTSISTEVCLSDDDDGCYSIEICIYKESEMGIREGWGNKVLGTGN